MLRGSDVAPVSALPTPGDVTNAALSILIAAGFLAVGSSRSGATLQGPRDSLRAGIGAYQQARFERAIPLLAYGLNPLGGPADSLWLASLYSLADALVQTGREPLGATWLRWALRHQTPRPLRVDDTNFPPTILGALAEAASAVRASASDDSLVETVWVWPSSPVAPNVLGALRLAPDDQLDMPLRASVEVLGLLSYGQLLPGEVRFLPAGTYTVTVYADDVRGARVTREVLPGLITEIHPRLLPARETVLYVLSDPEAAVLIDGQLAGVAQPVPPGRGQQAWVGERQVTFVWGYRLLPGRHVVTVYRKGYVPFDTVIVAGVRDRLRLAVRLAKQRDEPR